MQNRITEILNIQYPIVQGAMSWVTNAEFVAVVSNAGGLGILESTVLFLSVVVV